MSPVATEHGHHDGDAQATSAWDDALLAAACIAVDPIGLGGVRVHASAGPLRDEWTRCWRALLSASAPVRSVPLHVDDGRLIGGLDLAASLRAGRAIEQPGLLAQLDGGYAVLSMAERIEPSTAARIASVLETGRTGRGAVTRFAVIAFDEGNQDEGIADTLAERLALCIDLRACSLKTIAQADPLMACDRASIDRARELVGRVVIGDDVVEALCAAAVSLGILSLRAPLFAVRTARVIAALAGRDTVDANDAARAARLVFAARARRLATAPDSAHEDHADAEADDDGDADDAQGLDHDSAKPDQNDSSDVEEGASKQDDQSSSARGEIEQRVLAAAAAAMPAGLLERLAQDAGMQRGSPTRGSGSGASSAGRQRGSPAGIRRGRPRAPERLSLIDTLRSAAPWQRIRRAERSSNETRGVKVHVRADDLHVVRFKQRRLTTTVFVVDASGSSALHRLAEAKGAVELLLADCYVRRDSVAVLAFSGTGTQLLLPPTRSLVRARRSLAGLPGGGGTPLASALDATRELVVSLRRRGDTVLAVLLTDGRANVARDGHGGRPRAEADALLAGRTLRALRVDVLLIDTSPRPCPQAAALAEAMGALYRPLPHAGASEMSAIINQVARSPSNVRMS